MGSIKEKSGKHATWTGQVTSKKNSMLFILVIAIFGLLITSSMIYIAITNRVMEEQSEGLAMNGLVSALGTALPAVKSAFDVGLNDGEVLALLGQSGDHGQNTQAFLPFLITESDLRIVEGSNLPVNLAGKIEQACLEDDLTTQLVPTTKMSARIYRIESDRRAWMMAIAPQWESGHLFGLAHDITILLTRARRTQQALIGSLVLAYAIFLGLLILMLKVITRPLRTLTKAAGYYARGDFLHRVKVPTNVAELGVLADTFNYMGSELKMQHDSLEAYSHKLEDANCKAGAAVDELSRRNREQRVMIESILEANNLDLPEEIVQLILRRLKNDLNLESIAFYLHTHNGDFEQERFPEIPFPDTKPISGEALEAIQICYESQEPRRLLSMKSTGDSCGVPDESSETVEIASERLYYSLSVDTDKCGVLELVAKPGEKFETDTERFCHHFISYMEVILRNKALYQETVRRSHELERINLISRSISSKLDVDPLIRDVVEYTSHTINTECTFVGLLNNGRLEIHHITPGSAHLDEWVIDLKSNDLLNDMIESRQPLLVNDLQKDGRVQPDGFIASNSFRSFVGSPITRKDEVLGVICGFSHKAGSFTNNDSYFLSLLASQVAIALDNTRMFEEILARDRRRDHQLKMAQKLQENRIPQYFKQNVAAVSCKLQPADELAGDFCDVFTLGRNSIAVVIGDVANKGVAASLMTFSLLSMFRNVAKTLKPPCEILESINRSLISQVKEDGWFATAFYGRLNTRQGTLNYSSAGHERPIWYHAESGEVELLDAAGYPLGLFKSFPYETQEIEIRQGDRIVLYTDGVTDAMDANGDRFGHKALLEIIAGSGHLSGEELTQAIIDKVHEFTGGRKQKDDIIVAVLELQDDPWIHKMISFPESGDLINGILEALAPYDLDKQDTYSIRLAIDEAFANAWKHGLLESNNLKFDVSYHISDEGFRLRVKDAGSGFDHESLPDPTVEENLFKTNGRGVFLIRQMMDDVEYNDGGNEITVFKRFAPVNTPEDAAYDGLLLNSMDELEKQQESLENAKIADASDDKTSANTKSGSDESAKPSSKFE